jgi:hypothetical protein
MVRAEAAQWRAAAPAGVRVEPVNFEDLYLELTR